MAAIFTWRAVGRGYLPTLVPPIAREFAFDTAYMRIDSRSENYIDNVRETPVWKNMTREDVVGYKDVVEMSGALYMQEYLQQLTAADLRQGQPIPTDIDDLTLDLHPLRTLRNWRRFEQPLTEQVLDRQTALDHWNTLSEIRTNADLSYIQYATYVISELREQGRQYKGASPRRIDWSVKLRRVRS